MLAALVSVALLQTQPTVLYRSADITASDTKYWSVEDTQIDKSDLNRSSGQGLVLFLGKDKRAFLRFGDLRRALGPNKRIVSARLVLTPSYITTEGTLTLKRFGASWHESPGTGSIQPEPKLWSTSWDNRHFGFHRWRDGGREFLAATGASQSVPASASSVVFDGLAADVQAFYDRWYENHGWALEFTGDGGFNSAENRESGPRLEVVTQDVSPRTGADLSVTFIERTPEYKRYDNRGDAYARVGGIGVMSNPGEATSKKWPADGEEVTYIAHIKNVGDAPAQGFSYTWHEKLAQAGTGEGGALAPGQETTVSFKSRFKNEHRDHRTLPVSLKISPKGDDALAANDFLEIQSNALNIGIWVDQGFYDLFSKQVNGVGSRSFEDWIQWQFRIWNDVFMRHSRFSFAEDGARESVRVGRITIVPNGTLAGGAHVPGDTPSLVYDGEWGFDSAFGEAEKYIDDVRRKADRALIHEMSHQIGLIDMYVMNVDPSNAQGEGGKVRLQVNGKTPSRGSIDPFGGLMGGGDTRNDLLVPTQIAVPNMPTSDIVFVSPLFMPTDLYAKTDIAGLNSTVGFRRGFYGEYLYSLPRFNVLRVADRNGEVLTNGTLEFYQMAGGEIPNAEPAFTADFENGSARLAERPTGLSAPFTTLTGHTLNPNPFGRLDVVGSNGVFLIKLTYAGKTEFTWLKAWQLADLFARGSKTVATNELRFNVTHRPILPQDWALRKTAIDSANSDGANIAALIDGDNATLYRAGDKVDDWVEIDIGRDRPIGEIKIIAGPDASAFWKRFDIMVYGTGQTFSMARRFAGEAGWDYAVNMQRDVAVDGTVSVAYRGMPQTVRFIRLVNKSGGGGSIAGVEVRETEPPR